MKQRQFCIMSVLVFILASCSDNDSGGNGNDGDVCVGDLSSFCLSGECPSFEESRTTTIQYAEDYCFHAQIGRCGEYRFTSRSGGFGGPRQIFDTNGELVGASVSTDTNSFCDGGAFSIEYGFIPDCELVVEEDLCDSGNNNPNETPTPTAAPTLTPTPESTTEGCNAELSSYCQAGECPSFEESRTTTIQYATEGYCFNAQIGRCGEYRFTSRSGGFGGPRQIFDANGELVGARVSTDTNAFCDGDAFSIEYGFIPECEFVVEEDLCGIGF